MAVVLMGALGADSPDVLLASGDPEQLDPFARSLGSARFHPVEHWLLQGCGRLSAGACRPTLTFYETGAFDRPGGGRGVSLHATVGERRVIVASGRPEDVEALARWLPDHLVLAAAEPWCGWRGCAEAHLGGGAPCRWEPGGGRVVLSHDLHQGLTEELCLRAGISVLGPEAQPRP